MWKKAKEFIECSDQSVANQIEWGDNDEMDGMTRIVKKEYQHKSDQ